MKEFHVHVDASLVALGVILAKAHDRIARGHYGGCATVRKILGVGLWWLIMHGDVADYAISCDVC